MGRGYRRSTHGFVEVALQTKLPAYPGHEVIIVDRDVILVDIATQVIVDILTRVL